MCLNCGCGKPDDDHGNEADITMDDLRKAGEANGGRRPAVPTSEAYRSSSDAQGAGTGHQHSF